MTAVTKKTKKAAVTKKRHDDDDDAAEEDNSSVSVYDSADDDMSSDYDSNADDDDDDDDDNPNDEDEYSDGFEDQGSSTDESSVGRHGNDDDVDSSDDELQVLDVNYDVAPRTWSHLSKRPRDKRTDNATDKQLPDTTKQPTSRSSQQPPHNQSSTPVISAAEWMHTDNLSSDDEDPTGETNRTGRVPLHWYDEYDHLGYNAHGKKLAKPAPGAVDDALDVAIQQQDDDADGTLRVYDALNGKDVVLTKRQIELIRRVQSGAFAHPEFDATPDYVDYFSGVDKEISGLNSGLHPPKSRFQPSKHEKLLVRRLLHRLKCGSINMDYLTGKVRDMNDVIGKKGNKKKEERLEQKKNGTFILWKGDEEDLLNARKGPMHIAAPKVPPPGHAESYNPSEEYIPTEDEVKEWMEMDVKDRPHGLVIPKKFPNLRSVGAYEHSVRESFERCLDLYLCPRVFKRRLNIDPESLVPSLPKAADLRPFPTSQCLYYETPYDKENSSPPTIRCLSTCPNGHYLASGASDGFVRIWEVSTGRLLRSFDLSSLAKDLAPATNDNNTTEAANDGTDNDKQSNNNTDNDDNNEQQPPKPILALEWNPNPTHHVLLATCSTATFIIETGTANANDAEITDALLSAAARHKPRNDFSTTAVSWHRIKSKHAATTNNTAKTLSVFATECRPVAMLRTSHSVTCAKWHRKGDYFVTVAPAPSSSHPAAAAAVLIHQLSKASSQQPFSKAKGATSAQHACFHPSKPFLFVGYKTDVKVYHLTKQSLVRRLTSGCRWISGMSVHASGDHVIVGSLDRRLVWFDLDLGGTPYKTLKYHPRALRSVNFHARYPLMASSSDDGTIHVFHSMVYSDLMRNPLVVPVKVLKEHRVVNDLGVLASTFHPTQPWLFSGGADGKIILWQDI